MRSLLLHTNRFESEIVSTSNRPRGIVPEELKNASKKMENCLTVLFCIEKDDTEKQLNLLYESIIKDALQIGVLNIMIAPFVHLSYNIASPQLAKELYQLLLNKLKETNFTVDYDYFGYSKSWIMDIKGHRCAYKYREFN